MKLEDQVCSLEHAKRLKELGVKQDSYFYWAYSGINEEWEIHHFNYSFYADYADYAAFTVAELGEMLFYPILSEKQKDKTWRIFDDSNWTQSFIDINEADARAKMLIYLLENGLIKSD